MAEQALKREAFELAQALVVGAEEAGGQTPRSPKTAWPDRRPTQGPGGFLGLEGLACLGDGAAGEGRGFALAAWAKQLAAAPDADLAERLEEGCELLGAELRAVPKLRLPAPLVEGATEHCLTSADTSVLALSDVTSARASHARTAQRLPPHAPHGPSARVERPLAQRERVHHLVKRGVDLGLWDWSPTGGSKARGEGCGWWDRARGVGASVAHE